MITTLSKRGRRALDSADIIASHFVCGAENADCVTAWGNARS